MAKRKPTPEEAPADTPPAAAVPAGDYTVLARRYRPQQFAELVGQEPVAQALANAIQGNRVAHAYLFTGARGVGKTSAARILAKALNCSKGPTTTPCGECDNCRAIASGEDTDVLEIDGASNRGIDEVREIRQNVQYRPARGRYKIYIIDEVHMLTTPAFNALLKTLEEPPAHVKFIFATTESNKIPVTILSRCQRFDFGGIRLPRIVERLKSIVQSEGMQADDDALALVARRAGGSMRDAQSLLDQLLAFGGERLTAAAVHGLLGTADEARVADLADAVVARDTRRVLDLLSQAIDEGQQLGELLDQLLEYWRDLMVVSCAGESQELSVTGEARAQLAEQAKRLPLDTILAGLDVLVSAKGRMRATSQFRVLLEMALVRLCQLEDLVPLAQIVQTLQQGSSPAAPPAAPRRPAADSTEVAAVKKKSAPELKSAPAAEPAVEEVVVPLNEENLPAVWAKLNEEVGFALKGELRKALLPAISGPNALVIRYSSRYNTPGQFALDPTRVAQVESVLRKLTGQPCTIRIEFITEPGEEVERPRPTASNTNRQQMVELTQRPFVQRAKEVLGAQFVKADEGFGTPLPEAGAEDRAGGDEEGGA